MAVKFVIVPAGLGRLHHHRLPKQAVEPMEELIRTNDPVLLSWIEATLAENGIEAIIFDQYTSAAEGSIGALPRRVMVHAVDLERARRLIDAARRGALP